MKKYLIIAISVGACFCEELARKDAASDVNITADNMRYDTSHKHADATGNAKLCYTINDSVVTLTANTLHAQFNDQGTLIEAIAEGDVKIEYNETELYATKCVHNFNNDVAVCTGEDVKLTQDKNEIHGTKATLDIPTHVFTMQADQADQVTGVVYPKQKEDKHKNS